ncbi:MAG: endonuclease III [Syntrophobacteraceae bacterium]|nr:endonuclease III [Syntrophobacteraceae bacterium]
MGDTHINSNKVKSILKILDELYPDPQCSLNFENPLQLMVATILSAQCTDERVNIVTPALFDKYRSAQDFARAPLDELEQDIKSTGFYHNKATAIRESAKIISERFDGEVPRDMETLVGLPGVGRKTANVILGNAFGIPGIAVDTHVSRVSVRLGLTRAKDPNKIERDLSALLEKSIWVKFSHQLIQHGRRICTAKKPRCSICLLQPHCDYGMDQATAKF